MASLKGFWSYVHADDEADGGRIVDLARDVVAQFEMLTGETISLFLDRDALQWGDEWKQRIDEHLQTIAFFVPVLTPRYFRSVECRRELQFFARKSSSLGLNELVMPILYVEVPMLVRPDPEDDLVGIVQSFQWEDWRDLRFVDRSGGEYRRAVARLAQRLVEANRQAETQATVSTGFELSSTDAFGTEPEGVLDRLASAEEAMPKWNSTVEALAEEIAVIGEVVRQSVDDIKRSDQHGKGFAGRLFVARKTARELSDPVDRIAALANQFTSQLHEVDDGFRLMIGEASHEVTEHSDSHLAICRFFSMVVNLSVSARDALASVQGMIDAMSPVERLSRDLRPPLRRLREALTLLVDARGLTEEWVRMIEATGLDCSRFELRDFDSTTTG